MRPDTFEHIEIPSTLLGPALDFLESGMELSVEFFERESISVVFPDIAEARVASTAPVTFSQQDSTSKEAMLENRLSIRVPLFIAPVKPSASMSTTAATLSVPMLNANAAHEPRVQI